MAIAPRVEGLVKIMKAKTDATTPKTHWVPPINRETVFIALTIFPSPTGNYDCCNRVQQAYGRHGSSE